MPGLGMERLRDTARLHEEATSCRRRGIHHGSPNLFFSFAIELNENVEQASRIAEGLAYLHSKGIIHADLNSVRKFS